MSRCSAIRGNPCSIRCSPANVGARVTLEAILVPDRLNRLIDQHRRDPEVPGVKDVVAKLIGACFGEPASPLRLAAVQRRIQDRLVLELAQAERSHDASPEVAAEIEGTLQDLAAQQKSGSSAADADHRHWLVLLLSDRGEMAKFLPKPADKPADKFAVPPGSPIGEEEHD